MAEDVPQVIENVPHMADDVAQMSEDALQMIADVDATIAKDLDHDGVEGSHADEGFPSGPLLTSFAEHVAQAIWTGQECPELKLVSHERKVALIGRPVPAIEGCNRRSWTYIRICGEVAQGDQHLPPSNRELMITLDDVSSLFHLPISGTFHSFEALSVDEAVFLLMELLEVSVGCTLFSNKSATTIHVVHLEAFRDLGQSGGYAWRAAALYVIDDAYEETSPRSSWWLTMKAHTKGITGASYQARCDALTGQLRWGPMVVTVRPERVLCQFGYIQSIPPPSVSASLSYDDIDYRWMHFSDNVVAVGDLCVVPGQVSADYMEWFSQISHSFMIPTQAGEQPRHAPAPDHEDYMQPDIPQFQWHLTPLDMQWMVTAGAELHDIMQDCLRIVRGVPAQMEVLGLDKDSAQSIDDFTLLFVHSI
ncbi:hypothetical protein GmHk_14G040914 [Glycine max]|nr:hypothetical protein GmHk_14G040914 [Glycine max]